MWLLFFVIVTCVSADVSKTRVYNRKGSTSAKLPYPSLNCEHVLQNASLGASYYCPKGRKLGPDLLSCVDLDECAEWGCCDQLCENTIGSFKCSCGPGYSMLKDTYTCVADNSSALLLYFAYDNTVFSMDSFGRNITVVANTTQIAGFDYHYTKKVFYWYDIYTKRINIQSMDPNSQISISDDNKFLPNTWAPTAIAVDWIGNNLYVIDSFGRNIDLLDLQGHWRGTVLGNNVTIPSDIALDPTLGYMFIVDVVQILRANMDGTNLVTIVRNNYIINGVTVDTIAKRIYWFDFSVDCITTTDYDGRKKILVVCGQKIPYNTSLTVFENKLYWTEDTNKTIMSVNIFDNSSINSIYSTEDIRNLTIIKAYHPAVQSHIDNPCRSNNGGCQQICVLTNFKLSLGSRCACNMGWKLKSDERTCEIVTEFLLYSNKGFVKATVLDPIVDSLIDVFLPVASKGVLTLDFDAKDQQIYYTDVENGIYRNHINGTQKETVLAYKRSVEGLAVDWISKNIYYIDARENSLNILSIRNFTYQRTFLKNLKRPRGIAVHPNKGYVFFSEWWSPGNISRVLSDGSNLTVFKNLSLGWPNGLAIDFATDRLYWCDTRLQQVQHSTFDGTDVKTITSKLIKMPFNIVIYNDFMYTTDWKLKTITKHHKLTGESAEILSTFSRIPFGIKVYSEKEQQIIPNHPCWNNNGGCQKFCLAVPVDQNICLIAKCACPQGERLNDDEKTCRVDSNDMMLVREQPNSYFSCRNNRCIPKAWVCDGYDDCLDNSDELDCRTNLSCTTPNCEDKCQESPTGDSCYCHHGKKLAPDNQTCVDIDECAEWGSCDQLCENTVGSFKCSCAPGYSMASDTNRCIADNSSALLLFFAHDNVIVSFDPLTNNTKVVANSTEIGGFDYHYATNTLYWTDVRNRTIYATPISPNSKSFGTAVNISLLYTRIPSVIAVDWIGNKLYVVDTVYKKIDIFDLQGQWNATVLGNNLNDPTDLVLDPTIGYMFVADSDQVLRANMDGTNTVSIITDERYKTSGITVDIISKRLYWWNYISNYITTVDYDGQKRFVVVREEQIPDTVGLAIFENKIYWTDDTNKRIMSVDKFDNTTIHSIYNLTNIKNLKTIKAYHPAVQPHIDNPCGNNNGGCQQMCVLTNFKSSLGYRCACNMGWQLASDKLSCELVTDFLMYSLKIFLQGKVLNAVTEGFDIAMPPTHSYKTLALDFDGRDQYIYYGEKMAGAILRVHRNGTKNEVVTGSPTDVGEGLAIDWAGKNLYTVNDRQGLLNVLSTRNFTYRKTLLKNLHKPSGIVVHPNRGYVFFSEWDKPVQISRIMSDGSNLVVFRNLNLGCPTGLAIDFAMDRLYWCDSLLLHVQHSTFDGTDVKTITSKLIQHPYSIAIYNDFMYISDWNLRAVMKLHKYNAEFGEPFINVSQSDGPFGLKVYSTREQRIIPTHPCSNNNGGCQKFCFAVPGNSNTLIAKCGCPTGERLHNDNKICEADPNYKKPIQTCPINREFMCRNERCVPIYFVCDGQDNCLDNSDELNCPITCDSSRHFRCNNGRCIPKKSVCDDVHDCPDRSDEANCTKQCPYGFRCSYTHACLWKFMVCDGHNDCVDNEDEKDCSDGCPSNQFKCADMKQCVDKSSRCDGKTDCNDRSDEFNCEF